MLEPAGNIDGNYLTPTDLCIQLSSKIDFDAHGGLTVPLGSLAVDRTRFSQVRVLDYVTTSPSPGAPSLQLYLDGTLACAFDSDVHEIIQGPDYVEYACDLSASVTNVTLVNTRGHASVARLLLSEAACSGEKAQACPL